MVVPVFGVDSRDYQRLGRSGRGPRADAALDAVVDEVDNILIDEARTPLIISGPAEESTDKYYVIDRVIPPTPGEFDGHTVKLTSGGTLARRARAGLGKRPEWTRFTWSWASR